jgi:hypothetical protein
MRYSSMISYRRPRRVADTARLLLYPDQQAAFNRTRATGVFCGFTLHSYLLGVHSPGKRPAQKD